MIDFEKVTVCSGETPLISDVNFHVEPGEVFVLLGRSGSGKTTTLKLINRMLLPSKGSVRVQNKSTRDWNPIRLRRQIGYVIQEVGLFPHLSVGRNVGLVPFLEGWPSNKIQDRVDELLDLVGLAPEKFRNRFPYQLSGGQRQRVGIARALAADPPILLMDEPFGALDPLTRFEMQQQFVKIANKLGKTIMFVTHDVREALFLATRIGLFQDGNLVASGTRTTFLQLEHPEVKAFARSLEIP